MLRHRLVHVKRMVPGLRELHRTDHARGAHPQHHRPHRRHLLLPGRARLDDAGLSPLRGHRRGGVHARAAAGDRLRDAAPAEGEPLEIHAGRRDRGAVLGRQGPARPAVERPARAAPWSTRCATRLSRWFDRYVDPRVDGTHCPVTGMGQLDRIGRRTAGEGCFHDGEFRSAASGFPAAQTPDEGQ